MAHIKNKTKISSKKVQQVSVTPGKWKTKGKC